MELRNVLEIAESRLKSRSHTIPYPVQTHLLGRSRQQLIIVESKEKN